MRSTSQTAHYVDPNPTHCDDEYLPTTWQDHAERCGIPEPEIWPLWRRFKNVSRWPFERKRWLAYVDKVIGNRGRSKSE